MKINIIFLLICSNIYLAHSQHKNTSTFEYVKPLFDFNPLSPVVKTSNDNNEYGFLRFYALSGYREGVESTSGQFGLTFDGTNNDSLKIRRVYMYNLPIVDMVTHGLIKQKFVLLEVKNPEKYMYLEKYGSKKSWLRENGKSFELLLPQGMISLEVLDHYLSYALGLNFYKTTRKCKVYVLRRTSGLEKFKPKEATKHKKKKFNDKIIITSFDDLTSFLSTNGTIVLDETGYRKKVDLNLNKSLMNDPISINATFKKYDLVLQQEERLIELFIISDKLK